MWLGTMCLFYFKWLIDLAIPLFEHLHISWLTWNRYHVRSKTTGEPVLILINVQAKVKLCFLVPVVMGKNSSFTRRKQVKNQEQCVLLLQNVDIGICLAVPELQQAVGLGKYPGACHWAFGHCVWMGEKHLFSLLVAPFVPQFLFSCCDQNLDHRPLQQHPHSASTSLAKCVGACWYPRIILLQSWWEALLSVAQDLAPSPAASIQLHGPSHDLSSEFRGILGMSWVTALSTPNPWQRRMEKQKKKLKPSKRNSY